MWPRSSTRWSMRGEKTDASVQGEVEPGRAEGVPFADVGLPPRSGELDDRGAASVGGPVRGIPKLKDLYRVRLRFKEIFDTARDRTTAARWLRQLRRETEELGLDLSS